MPKINGKTLKQLAVPIPSLGELKVSVELLEAHLSNLSKLADRIASQLEVSRAMRASILKSAFSGQLVPQDPGDEPASELLARIRAS